MCLFLPYRTTLLALTKGIPLCSVLSWNVIANVCYVNTLLLTIDFSWIYLFLKLPVLNLFLLFFWLRERNYHLLLHEILFL